MIYKYIYQKDELAREKQKKKGKKGKKKRGSTYE